MKIILLKTIESIGEAGDIINVKPGYGRNYIIPRGIGILATKSAIEATKKQVDQKEMKEAKTKKAILEPISINSSGFDSRIFSKAQPFW